jgi:beta-glucosidase
MRAALGSNGRILYAQGSGYVEGVSVPVPETAFDTMTGEPGLRGEYFSNTDLSGKPAMTRTDRQIDFDWNGATPDTNINPKNFSVRWTGTISVPAAGEYSFVPSLAHCYPCGDAESFTVYIDDVQLADQRFDVSAGRGNVGKTFRMNFTDTKPHDFRMEYTHAAPHFASLSAGSRPPRQ